MGVLERHLLQRRPSAEVAAELGLTVATVNVNLFARPRSLAEAHVDLLEELADGVEPLPRAPWCQP